MPRFNGTGPWALGPGTGWGLGPCGAGIAWRQGLSRQYGLAFRRFISPKNQLAALEEEEKMLEKELAAIREEKEALKAKQKR